MPLTGNLSYLKCCNFLLGSVDISLKSAKPTYLIAPAENPGENGKEIDPPLKVSNKRRKIRHFQERLAALTVTSGGTAGAIKSVAFSDLSQKDSLCQLLFIFRNETFYRFQKRRKLRVESRKLSAESWKLSPE